MSAMAVARGANLRAVPRARRGAPISARPMAEANAAHGARRAQALGLAGRRVTSLLVARLVFVQVTVLWLRIAASMVVAR